MLRNSVRGFLYSDPGIINFLSPYTGLFNATMMGQVPLRLFIQNVIKIIKRKGKIHMIYEIIFYIGLSLFFVHEMDAVRRNEWKMFIYLPTLKPEMGYVVFSLIHVPCFVLIFLGLFSADQVFRHYFIMFLNIFFIIHFFLHLVFIRHPNNEFRSAFSWFIIGGMFLMGMFNIWGQR